MAHLGEQAITGERLHDADDRRGDGPDWAHYDSASLADALRNLVARLFVDGHRNAELLQEAAHRLETGRG